MSFFKAENPDILLSVICTALHVAESSINGSNHNFQAALERYDAKSYTSIIIFNSEY